MKKTYERTDERITAKQQEKLIERQAQTAKKYDPQQLSGHTEELKKGGQIFAFYASLAGRLQDLRAEIGEMEGQADITVNHIRENLGRSETKTVIARTGTNQLGTWDLDAGDKIQVTISPRQASWRAGKIWVNGTLINA